MAESVCITLAIETSSVDLGRCAGLADQLQLRRFFRLSGKFGLWKGLSPARIFLEISWMWYGDERPHMAGLILAKGLLHRC